MKFETTYDDRITEEHSAVVVSNHSECWELSASTPVVMVPVTGQVGTELVGLGGLSSLHGWSHSLTPAGWEYPEMSTFLTCWALPMGDSTRNLNHSSSFLC